MITVNLSIDQLAEAVRNLNSKEKQQLRNLLAEDEFVLSETQDKILMERDTAYERGEMITYTVDELKARLNYKDK